MILVNKYDLSIGKLINIGNLEGLWCLLNVFLFLSLKGI